PAAGKIRLQEPQQGAVPMRLGKVGPIGERPIEGGARLSVTVLVLQREPQVVARFRIVVPQRQRALETRDGPFELPQLVPYESQVVVIVRRLLVAGTRVLQPVAGLLESLLLIGDDAEIVAGDRMR